MHPLIPVMAGGAFGAGLRYLTSVALPMRGGWPWATFVVNLAGALAMGLLAGWLFKGQASETLRLFAGVGILGGFTTFSAFSLETWQLIERGQSSLAVTYALGSVIGSVAALALGMAVSRA